MTHTLYKRDGSDFTHSYPRLLYYPLRSVVQSEGGFAAYCCGPVFAASIGDDVAKWQSAAREWNRTVEPGCPSHDPATIDTPELAVHLLDPDDGEPLMVKVRGFTLPPPHPAPATTTPPPSPAKPGIGRVLRQPIKKKKKVLAH